MELSKLEADLLGDLAQDDHQLFEIFQFVRLHHGGEPATVRAVGRELLATWIARGWLQVASPARTDGSIHASGEIGLILEYVDGAETLDAGFRGADLWLRLTDQAYADVGWLNQAS